jgi:hypothetical protein
LHESQRGKPATDRKTPYHSLPDSIISPLLPATLYPEVALFNVQQNSEVTLPRLVATMAAHLPSSPVLLFVLLAVYVPAFHGSPAPLPATYDVSISCARNHSGAATYLSNTPSTFPTQQEPSLLGSEKSDGIPEHKEHKNNEIQRAIRERQRDK